MLWLERGYPRHHGFHNTRAVDALRPQTAFALEYPRTNCPIGRSIRRLYLEVAHHRLQSLAPLEPLSAGPFGLGHPTGLARFQPPLHFAPDRPPIRGIARRSQRPVTDAVPPGEQLVGLRPPYFAIRAGALPARAHRFVVAPPMCPPHLPPPARGPGSGAPAIRDSTAPEAFSPEFLGHLATARLSTHTRSHPL